MAMNEIECRGNIDETYKIWSNVQLALTQTMKDEYLRFYMQ